MKAALFVIKSLRTTVFDSANFRMLSAGSELDDSFVAETLVMRAS